MTTPGVPKGVPRALQPGLEAALAPAGVSTAIPPVCVLAAAAGRVVPGCAGEASAAAGAAESIVAAMTAIASFRRTGIPVLSLVPVRKLRRGGWVAIEVRFMNLPFARIRAWSLFLSVAAFTGRRDKRESAWCMCGFRGYFPLFEPAPAEAGMPGGIAADDRQERSCRYRGGGTAQAVVREVPGAPAHV